MLKFKNPQNKDEEQERFVLVEDRGDRMLVEFVCDMGIRPVFVYATEELEQA